MAGKMTIGADLQAIIDAVNISGSSKTFTLPNVSGTFLLGTGTANEIPYFVNANTIGSLTTATYPSLTELAYLKGTTSAVQTQLNAKQATLVSGTNIKTINGNSLLGSGDLVISGGVSDADYGDITVSSTGTVWTIDNGVVTLAKQADVATATVFYRKTAGSGAPEVQTLATLKTDLGLTGTNSGDQTSIVGITGTKAQFDTAVTDGNFLYVGDITQYTDELAQDAVGAMVDTTLVYTDGTPLLSRAALTGAITASAGSNTTALGSFTLAALNTAISDGNVGDVFKVGTPANNQIGVWTGDGTIEGDTNFTWDATTLTINGTIAGTAQGRIMSISDNTTADYSNVAQFNSSISTTRASITLSNSSSGDWANNYLIIAVTGASHAVNNYFTNISGKTTDAGYSMLVNGGSQIAGMLIGTSTSDNVYFGVNNTSYVTLATTSLSPTTNDLSALGTTALQWSDLFLAEGGVINWDNGDVLLTQTGNELALTGGILRVTGDFTGGVVLFERTNAATNATLGTVKVKGTSTGDMTDGFGAAFQFYIQDTAAVENYIADIRGVRNGADNTGKLTFGLAVAGVTDSYLQLTQTSLSPFTNDVLTLGTTSLKWSDLFIATGGVINFNSGGITITHTDSMGTQGISIAGGNLNLLTNGLLMTGSIGITASRVTKGWFTDIESTNMPTVGGTSLSSTFQPLDTQLTSLAGLSYAGNALKFIRVNAGGTDFELVTLSGGGDALTSAPLSQFASTTSAQLAGIMSDETGTDKLVFNTSPGFATAANPISNDGAALGTTALGWSDVFLASGAVINFNNGNATLTHSAALLTSNVDIVVPAEAYGASWNGSNEVATKNDIFDSRKSTAGVGTSPTSSTTTTITHNLGYAPSIIRIAGIGTFTSNNSATPTTHSRGVWNTTGNTCIYQAYNTALLTTSQAGATSTSFAIRLDTGANNFITGVIGNVTSTQFDIVWTETGTATAQVYMWEAE